MKKILFISATHGNEGFSADVLKEVEQEYDPEQYGYDWIIGNPEAYKRGVRFTDTDLNRSAPGDMASTSYEERRAAEIVEMSANYDAVIDIHGSMADCGLVNLIPNPTPLNLRLAKSIPLARNVIWYSERSAICGPLTQHTLCPAIEIECGPQDSKVVSEHLRLVLGQILVAKFENSTPDYPEQEYYTVYGKQLGQVNPAVQDFQATTLGEETFYPFLANRYKDVLCYKMRKNAPE